MILPEPVRLIGFSVRDLISVSCFIHTLSRAEEFRRKLTRKQQHSKLLVSEGFTNVKSDVENLHNSKWQAWQKRCKYEQILEKYSEVLVIADYEHKTTFIFWFVVSISYLEPAIRNEAIFRLTCLPSLPRLLTVNEYRIFTLERHLLWHRPEVLIADSRWLTNPTGVAMRTTRCTQLRPRDSALPREIARPERDTAPGKKPNSIWRGNSGSPLESSACRRKTSMVGVPRQRESIASLSRAVPRRAIFPIRVEKRNCPTRLWTSPAWQRLDFWISLRHTCYSTIFTLIFRRTRPLPMRTFELDLNGVV